MTTPMRQKAIERQKIIDDLRQLLVDNLYLQLAPQDIDPDTTLFGSGLGLDSVDAIELIVSVESRFQVRFSKQPEVQEVNPKGFGTLSEAIHSDEQIETKEARQVEQNLRVHLRNLNALTDLILFVRRTQTEA